jgi:TPR repeat protein
LILIELVSIIGVVFYKIDFNARVRHLGRLGLCSHKSRNGSRRTLKLLLAQQTSTNNKHYTTTLTSIMGIDSIVNALLLEQTDIAHVDLFDTTPQNDECVICTLPFPHSNQGRVFTICCGASICCGCNYHHIRAIAESRMDNVCPFCREPKPKDKHVALKNLMNRDIDYAFMHMGDCLRNGHGGYTQSSQGSLEMYAKAARLGNAEAYGVLYLAFRNGILFDEGDEQSNQRRAIELLKIGARRGSVKCRHTLSNVEERVGNYVAVKKHVVIAAKMGCQDSMTKLLEIYKRECPPLTLEKKELDSILRVFHVANSAMESEQRSVARQRG